MNDTAQPTRFEEVPSLPPKAPPLPKGYKLLEPVNTERSVWLNKGWLVYNPVAPIHGWSRVEHNCLFYAEIPAVVAVPDVTPASDYAAPAAKSVLEDAYDLVNGDRQQSYGDAYQSFDRIAKLWSAYKGIKITPKDVASMMILMKVSRSVTSSKRDNWIDVCGYAELGSQIEAMEAAPE
jgi:hypothetical protein